MNKQILKNRFLSTLAILFLLTGVCFGQSAPNPDNIAWSDTERLTARDFTSKNLKMSKAAAYAKFSMEYQISGLDFFAKNFNQKVQNYFIRSGSWIDPQHNVQHAIRYQQTLFDLQEIYTRQFRKELRENRKKIAKGMGFIEEMNERILQDLNQRQQQYSQETESGKVEEKQVAWEALIKKELASLAEYSYDNK